MSFALNIDYSDLFWINSVHSIHFSDKEVENNTEFYNERTLNKMWLQNCTNEKSNKNWEYLKNIMKQRLDNLWPFEFDRLNSDWYSVLAEFSTRDHENNMDKIIEDIIEL